MRLSTIDGEYRKFHKLLNDRRKELISSGADDRTAFIRAVTYAGLTWMFPELEEKIREHQADSIYNTLKEIKELDPVTLMMEDLATMLTTGKMLANRDFLVTKQGIAFTSFRALYNSWASYLAESRTRPPHSINTMKEYCNKSDMILYKSVRLPKISTPIKAYLLNTDAVKHPHLYTMLVDSMYTNEAITLDRRRELLQERNIATDDCTTESEF